jgi:hypothetical protein
MFAKVQATTRGKGIEKRTKIGYLNPGSRLEQRAGGTLCRAVDPQPFSQNRLLWAIGTFSDIT